MYRIGEIAELSGVSVRALRHYDEIGLVQPCTRTGAGYRLYSLADLERLQEVLFFRELGFELSSIRDIVDDPTHDRAAALRTQRALLESRAEKQLAMIDLINRTLEAMEKGTSMDAKELLEVFGDFDPKQYEREVQERWGDTDAYRESMRRTQTYTKQDWERIREEQEGILQRMIEAFDQGIAPTDAHAMDIAEAARLAINRAFYPCSRAMHEQLGKGYVADPRFRAHYDVHREGLAAWFSAAISANATQEHDAE